VVAEIDIWRAARLMVQRHGADAATEAAMRADERLAAGDLDGQATWKRILAAIEGLQKAAPGDGEAVH
jgi:hypothetical protein